MEMSKPEWLKSRPVSSLYFYGIGITPKLGGAQFYEEKAKERALADLAKQINTRVKSETSFYKMEDNKGVYEYIQSRINATSNEFLEGYEFVDKWEDDNNSYAYYRLSKQEFYALKEKRKQKALELAWLKINQAQEKENRNKIREAIELYASGIDALSGHLDEEVSKEVNGQKIDLFVFSKEQILNMLKQLEINCESRLLTGKTRSDYPQGSSKVLVRFKNISIDGIPVQFIYSGGYIINDKKITDINGEVLTPALAYNNKPAEQLIAEIDYINLSRLVSKNLFVRQLIEKQKKQNCIIEVNFQ